MVYTDGIHLTADSLDELYLYANKTGLNPAWIDFMGRTIHPHFNICGHVKRRVLADMSVQKVSCKEIVRLCQLNFRLPENQAELQKNKRHDMPSESDFQRMIDNIFKRAGITRSLSSRHSNNL